MHLSYLRKMMQHSFLTSSLQPLHSTCLSLLQCAVELFCVNRTRLNRIIFESVENFSVPIHLTPKSDIGDFGDERQHEARIRNHRKNQLPLNEQQFKVQAQRRINGQKQERINQSQRAEFEQLFNIYRRHLHLQTLTEINKVDLTVKQQSQHLITVLKALSVCNKTSQLDELVTRLTFSNYFKITNI